MNNSFYQPSLNYLSANQSDNVTHGRLDSGTFLDRPDVSSVNQGINFTIGTCTYIDITLQIGNLIKVD